jgi:exodeoxyribonuclease III
MTSIISYNVNGVRAAIKKGFYDWLAEANPDIICLQETKATLEDVDVQPLEALGYHHNWFSAEKKGYSGVATFSKKQPDTVVEGCGIAKYDSEGRILRTDFGDWTLLNCYLPSGTSGDERQAFKMEFLDDFFDWATELKRTRPNLVILGDYNIAHQEIDLHSPKTNNKTSGFLPEERAWMTKWLTEGGFTDAFRAKRPDMQQYSWWSTRFNSRANNKGWRIDYQCVSGTMATALQDAVQLNDVVHSDHCPVWASYALQGH